MHAAVLVLALLRVLGVGTSTFDHHVHDRDVAVSGAEPLLCTRCHAVKAGLLVGRPDHAACFGTCHGAAPGKTHPIKPAPEQLRLCTACHTEASLLAPRSKAVGVVFPPYTPADFSLAAGHKMHREVTCTACHPTRAAAPHKRCAGCHDGGPAHGPAMTACVGCHTPGSGKPEPPRLIEPVNTITAAFSHPKHTARGGAAADCVTCHASVRDTDDFHLPRPVATACSGCHDITQSCTKCHPQPPTGKFEVERRMPRFTHATHLTGDATCAQCHSLSKSGELIVAGHAACAPCHAPDFGARKPKICGACHNASEPWRPLVADRMPPDTTELGVTLDHRKHPTPCESCHSLTTRTTQLRPPRGHRACTGAACHAVSGGAAPQLGACESCHQVGLAAKRTAQRLAAPWSVRALFDHAPHRRAADGTPLACTACHTDLGGASIDALATPAKATCAPCHDGTTAFKLTGTTCTRCHLGGRP